MRTRADIAKLRAEILEAAAESGARDVRVFGSVARGDAGEASDVDFLVRLDAGRTLIDLARLEARLERLLRCRVDVVTERGLEEPLRSDALRDAVSV